jgi:hypothetical protein
MFFAFSVKDCHSYKFLRQFFFGHQGDLIGRICAYWMINYFVDFLENIEVEQIFGLIFLRHNELA